MKFLILFTLLFLGIACTPDETPKVENKLEVSAHAGNEYSQVPSVSIELIDRVCVTDADCDSVATKCSCSCGEGVAKIHVEKYTDLLEEKCKDYQGPFCKVKCSGTTVCREKICTYVDT